ncbi:ORF119 [Ranid herpesvirus 2]|uniref:ORF119 n=1 Tax=Ranid herpesvirus 2 TaxID=389214 RepID=Q14VY7_9VIRU|nr:ORF119 [Ranid herpesvirus 2]ABG25632.1 ORF119 [Ranid herpesvirus 2]
MCSNLYFALRRFASMASDRAKSATCRLKGSTNAITLPLKVNFQLIEFYGVPFAKGDACDLLFQSHSLSPFYEATDKYTHRLGHQSIDAFWLNYERGEPVLYHVDSLAGDLIFRLMHQVNKSILDEVELDRAALKKALDYLRYLTTEAPPWFKLYHNLIEGTHHRMPRVSRGSVTDLVLDVYEKQALTTARTTLQGYCDACIEHVQALSRLYGQPTYIYQPSNPYALQSGGVDTYETVYPLSAAKIHVPKFVPVGKENIKAILGPLYEKTILFYSKQCEEPAVVEQVVRSDASPSDFKQDYSQVVRLHELKSRYGSCYYVCLLEFWTTLMCGT